MANVSILFNPVDSEATGCQRLIYPLKALEKRHIYSEILNTQDVRKQLKKAKLVYLQCLIGPQQRELLDYCKSQNKTIIIDYDDNYAELPDHVLSRFNMSRSEILENWKYYLNAADFITVPCDQLFYEIGNYTKKPIAILPNYIPEFEYHASKDYDPFKDIESIRLLYSCSESHLDDFKFITTALKWIGEKYPQVQIITNGKLNFTYYCPEYTGNSTHVPRTSYGSYYRMLRDIKPHIFIAPVLNNTYNRCRSDLKALQAATIKAAFVGSDIGVYNKLIHGYKGYLTYNLNLMWFWYLRKLILNIEKTKLFGEIAYDCAKNHILEYNINKWYDLISPYV